MREKQERLTHKMIARRTRDCSKEKRDKRGTGRRSEAETQGSRKSKLLWERGGTGRQGKAFPHRKCEQYDRVPTKVWQFIQNIIFRID